MPKESRKGHLVPRSWICSWLCYTHLRILGTELRPSAKAVYCWANSPNTCLIFLKKICCSVFIMSIWTFFTYKLTHISHSPMFLQLLSCQLTPILYYYASYYYFVFVWDNNFKDSFLNWTPNLGVMMTQLYLYLL